jgi:hypothetical protein
MRSLLFIGVDKATALAGRVKLCGRAFPALLIYQSLKFFALAIFFVRESEANGAQQDGGIQNFPNPFGSGTSFTTTIPFTTSTTGVATIRIVDERGNVILTDDEDVSYIGTHFFYFTGKELPSGTYYYQIEFPKGVIIVNRSMLLVK